MRCPIRFSATVHYQMDKGHRDQHAGAERCIQRFYRESEPYHEFRSWDMREVHSVKTHDSDGGASHLFPLGLVRTRSLVFSSVLG